MVPNVQHTPLHQWYPQTHAKLPSHGRWCIPVPSQMLGFAPFAYNSRYGLYQLWHIEVFKKQPKCCFIWPQNTCPLTISSIWDESMSRQLKAGLISGVWPALSESGFSRYFQHLRCMILWKASGQKPLLNTNDLWALRQRCMRNCHATDITRTTRTSKFFAVSHWEIFLWNSLMILWQFGRKRGKITHPGLPRCSFYTPSWHPHM